MARRPLIAANWKMNKTIGEARAFCEALLPEVEERGEGGAEVVICPPYLALPLVAQLCEGTGIGVAAQNMYYEESGAYTGEVSAAMLLDAGAGAVVLGHSERRQLFGESDEAMLAYAAARGLPSHVLLSKCDKLARAEAKAVLAAARATLGTRAGAQLFSAETGEGVDAARAALEAMLAGHIKAPGDP